ncbi:Carbohydrate sulfotransferase 1 [Branchiostoma belcheri]|nr:Carbohydrate sulfotransferase 1 [Branchiostoma belcheri]
MACPVSPWRLLQRKRYVFYSVLFVALFALAPLFYDVGLLRPKPTLANQNATRQREVPNITGRGTPREHHNVIASSPRHVSVKPWTKIFPAVTGTSHNTDRRKTTKNVHLSSDGANLVINTEMDDSDEKRKHVPSLHRSEMPPRIHESPPYHHVMDSMRTTSSVPRQEDMPLDDNLAPSRSDLARVQGQTKRLGVVILALMRTGSSFVSELVNNNLDFFYLFEPMWTLKHNGKYFFRPKGKGVVADTKGIRVNQFDREYTSLHERAKLQMLSDVFHCNFTVMAPFYTSYLTGAFIGRNASRTVNDACRNGRFIGGKRTGRLLGSRSRPVCPMYSWNVPRVLADLCTNHKHSAVKTIRVASVEELVPLIQDPSLDMKILHLIRDPRAIVASRLDVLHPGAVRNLSGLQELLVRSVEFDDICGWMESNVQYRDHIPQYLQGRYALVRYEDVAANPSAMAEKIYNFLGIPLPDEVMQWIDKNTKGSHHIVNKYQTNRNSRASLDTWRHKLVFSSVSRIQDRCRPIMAKLGYRPVNSTRELTNMTNILIEEPSPEIANLII